MGVRASFGSTAPAVPGQAARYALAVENTGNGDEDVAVEVVGEAAAWAWATPATLTVAPGTTATVTVTVKLPLATFPPAGPLTLAASVVGAGTPAQPVRAETVVEVARHVAVLASLRPHTSSGNTAGQHVLTVENRGNAPVAVTVEGDHTGDGALSVVVDPDRLEAQPGEQAEARVTVKAGRRVRGAASARPFAVVVRPEGGGGTARAEGAVELPAGGWVGRAAVGVLVLALGGAALWATVGSRSGSGSGAARAPAATEAGAAAGPAATDCPGRDHLSPDANGVVRPGVKPAFDYTFLFVGPDGCQPARFNPCAPVRYVLNRAEATDADVADLDEALRKLSEATGLEFQSAGTSTEDPRNPARPVRAADGSLTWPPVLIGWMHLGTGAQLRPSTSVPAPANLGVVGGGGRPLVTDNVITTGNLVLNLDAVTDTDTHDPVPHGFGPGVNWGRIMMHELAHVVGLGHVQSRTSIMNENLTEQTISSSDWGIGDLIGLRYLGRQGGCLTVPKLQVTGTPPR